MVKTHLGLCSDETPPEFQIKDYSLPETSLFPGYEKPFITSFPEYVAGGGEELARDAKNCADLDL